MPIKPTPSFWKVVGLLALLSLAPVSIYMLYTRTGGLASKNEMAFQKNLRYALMRGNDAIDLAPLTPWPWQTVCAFDAQVGEADMNAILGFDYEHYDELHWLGRRDHWTLLFIDSEREVSWGAARPVVPVRISRPELANVEFPEGSIGVCAPRDSGRFTVTRHDAPVGTSPVTVRLEVYPPSKPVP
ncbi:MAG: hypothetical protein KDE14_06340 [Rhodobacteraceae bacterium]|nr:hypothetical protein [Paracoccaceae bacterium]